MKKVSLIMTTYNSKENFKKTYGSICSQDYPQIEVIVVDGASTDGTREEIEMRAKENPAMRWISEKDTGIYDALNKGIRMATGDIIAIMNDEYACVDAVSRFVNAIETEHSDGVHSDLIYQDENGRCIRKWHMGQGKIRSGWMPGHPTLFLKREVYEKYGLYKENYRSAADYEFMVRILNDGKVRLSYIPKVLVHMYYGGTSNHGLKGYGRSFAEGVRALRENGVKGALWITLLRTVRVMGQFRGSGRTKNENDYSGAL